jgi:GntR family transcriptional regulator
MILCYKYVIMSIQDYKKILSQYSQMIRENVNLPLYYQVELIINNFIENEDIKHGVSFFSEIEVAEELNVSRPTVNKAFKNLVEKGLLTKKRGKRNVVNKVDNIRLVFISELVSFGQMIQTQGVKCKTVLLDRMKIKATPKVQGALKLQPGDEVVYLKRLRFVKNDPIIIVESYLPFPKYGKLLNIPAESYSEDLSKMIA